MTRWRVVQLEPGDLVPPRVHVGLVLELDDAAGPGIVELVETAAARAGVRLEREPSRDNGSSSSSSSDTGGRLL